MTVLRNFLQWFAGGSTPYMRLTGCMHGDVFWITLTLMLDLSVGVGYGLIAMHWWKNSRSLPATSPARSALNNMRNIFLFCGLCGYIFIPTKMFWPAWRLYDLFMMALVYSTWRYAWNARDLKVIYSELGRSTKLAADLERIQEESRQKSLFLNSISHDLRTPLNSLVLQANVAKLGLAGDQKETVATALAEIETSARATGDLLDRLLEYARLNAVEERNNPTRLSLRALVLQVMRTQHASAEAKGLALQVKVPEDLEVVTDSVKLERILNNLVNNAIKFTREGSITIEAHRAANAVEMEIADTGIGISPEDQEHLFEEFFQTNNRERDRAKGFGLGLAIARRLALQLGGDIGVESAVGRGTRFSILLPQAERSVDEVAIGTGRAALAT